MITFLLTYGCLYGGVVYVYSPRIRQFFVSRRLNVFPVFMIVSILVSVTEELYVYALGNKIAVPSIWRDIIIVPGVWSVWFATWYLYISKKYSFTVGEALLAAGMEGVLFEYLGKILGQLDPLELLIAFPGTVIVYAAIFILPMNLMNFEGTTKTYWKYPVSVFLPYVLTIPVALLLYALFY